VGRGSPSGPTKRTGTTIPSAQWPGMWQPTNQPPSSAAAAAGTVHMTSIRSPERTTIRRPASPAATDTAGVGPGGALAVAASAASQASWTGRGPKFVFINIDAADLTPPREALIALRADARQALELLSEAVRPRRVLTEERATALKQWAQNQIDAVSPQASYVRALRDALPENGIFVNELTQVGYLSRVAFQVYGPNTYVGPGYQGTLGYGFPTALGAAVGGNGRRVVSITGDGGFGWNLQELATARKYDLPVTLVVFNDGHFGNVRAIQKRVFGLDEAFGTNLENPDFMTLAKAFRVPGVRVDSPDGLNAAVKTSLQETGPVLIEARVGEMPSPWPLLRLQPLPGVKVPDSGPNPLPARAPAAFRRVGKNSR